jgi:hypothetical protein
MAVAARENGPRTRLYLSTGTARLSRIYLDHLSAAAQIGRTASNRKRHGPTRESVERARRNAHHYRCLALELWRIWHRHKDAFGDPEPELANLIRRLPEFMEVFEEPTPDGLPAKLPPGREKPAR